MGEPCCGGGENAGAEGMSRLGSSLRDGMEEAARDPSMRLLAPRASLFRSSVSTVLCFNVSGDIRGTVFGNG